MAIRLVGVVSGPEIGIVTASVPLIASWVVSHTRPPPGEGKMEVNAPL